MNRSLITNLFPFYFPADSGGSGGSGGDAGGGDGDGDNLSRDLAEIGDIEEGDGEGEGDGDGEGDSGDGEGGDEGEGEGDAEGEGDENEDDEEELDDEGNKKPKVKAGEEEESVDDNGRPTFKAVKTAYPDLFKKFPSLKAAFFEYPKMIEIFPDVESAQEAAATAAEFQALETSLVDKGDPSDLLKTLEKNAPKSLKKIVQKFGPTIRELDQALYTEMSTPIIEELIYHSAKYGERTGNKNLILAAKHLSNFVFMNGGEIPDISKRESKTDPAPTEAEKELEKERARNQSREFDRAFMEIGESSIPVLNRILENKLDGLTPFERKTVVKEARTEVDRILKADKGFQKTLSALWARARADGFSDMSKSRIKKAWLDRAKTAAPAVRNRLRQEAIDGRTETTPRNGDANKNKDKKRQFPNSGGQRPGRSAGLTDPSKINWRKTSDMDILNS